MTESLPVSLVLAALAGLLAYVVAWAIELAIRALRAVRARKITCFSRPAGRLRRRAKTLREARARVGIGLAGAGGAALAALLTRSTALPAAGTLSWPGVTLSIVWLCLMVAYLVVLTRQLHGLRLPIEAGRRVAQHLRGINGEYNRVFHDVTLTDKTWIDHVLVGVQGLYAIVVIAEPTRKNQALQRRGELLKFGTKGPYVDLGIARERARQLQHTLSKSLGKMVRLRLVVSIPDWRCESDAHDDILLVGASDVVMLQGWRDASDALMTDEALAIQEALQALDSGAAGQVSAQQIAAQSLQQATAKNQSGSVSTAPVTRRPQVSG
ncbi:MAG: nuclease-related domain-containing protein [Pseudomonadota bacterium]